MRCQDGGRIISVVNGLLGEMKQYLKLAEYRQNSACVIDLVPVLREGARLLDIGCANGNLSLRYAEKSGISVKHIFGVEFDPDSAQRAQSRFKVSMVDMETERLPFAPESFDLVVCNQILEHVKNVKHFMSEVDQVTKAYGYVLISVPNLAAFHNRFALLFGRQPRCIKVTSEHIRGFVPSALKAFLATGDHFRIVASGGSGFYPLPPLVSRLTAKIFPTMSVYYSVLLQKTRTDDWDSWNRLTKV